MKPKLIKFFSYSVRAIGIFLIIFTLLAFGESISYIIASVNHGTLGYEEDWGSDADTSAVIVNVIKGSSAYNAGIMSGDTIVKVNGSSFNREEYQKLLGLPELGRKVSITIQRNGIQKDFELVYSPSPLYDKLLELLFRIVPAFLMLIYILVGFWGVFKSPYSTETMLIAMFCFCFGSFMFATIGFNIVMQTFISKYFYFNQLKSAVMIFSLFETVGMRFFTTLNGKIFCHSSRVKLAFFKRIVFSLMTFFCFTFVIC